MTAIEKRARSAHGIPGTAEIDRQSLARLIFKSGFTTRDQTTLISGRGLGMDAVRSLLHEVGGTIEIFLDEEKDAQHCSFHFEIQLPLQAHALADVS
jgi:chemotaxis protein histidine kinase CheA